MGFSWKENKKRTLAKKIQRAILMCKTANNPSNEGSANVDFITAHPDEVRDSSQKNYTKLIKRITEQYNKNEKIRQNREEKKIDRR